MGETTTIDKPVKTKKTTDKKSENKGTATKTAPKAKSQEGLKVAKAAAETLKMISDPTRIRIILALAEGEKSVTELCQILGQAQAAVSHHMSIFRHAGVTDTRREGKFNFYFLTGKGERCMKLVTLAVE